MLRRVAVGSDSSPTSTARISGSGGGIFGSSGATLTIGGTMPADGSSTSRTASRWTAPRVRARHGQPTVPALLLRRAVRSPLAWGERGRGEGNPGFNWPRGSTVQNGAARGRSGWRHQEQSAPGVPTGRQPTGRKFGTAGAAGGELKWPFGVAAAGADLLVADSNSYRVHDGPRPGRRSSAPVPAAAGSPSRSRRPSRACGLAQAADTQRDRIAVLDADTGAFGDAFVGSGWAARMVSRRAGWRRVGLRFSEAPLAEFAADGTLLQTFGSAGSGNTQFNKPLHLATHVTGSGAVLLFVADSWNDRIQVFQVA